MSLHLKSDSCGRFKTGRRVGRREALRHRLLLNLIQPFTTAISHLWIPELDSDMARQYLGTSFRQYLSLVSNSFFFPPPQIRQLKQVGGNWGKGEYSWQFGSVCQPVALHRRLKAEGGTYFNTPPPPSGKVTKRREFTNRRLKLLIIF